MTTTEHGAVRRVAEALAHARLIGAGKADSDFVLAHTGQIISGVAPVGHPAPIRTLVDRTLAGYPVIWAAAGHPKAMFPTSFEQLVVRSTRRADRWHTAGTFRSCAVVTPGGDRP